MAQPIEIIRGTTNSFEISLSDSSYSAYALQAGEKILFGVKKDPADADYVFIKTLTESVNGAYPVTLAPEDTANVEPGRYVYDVGVQSGADYFNVIAPSLFEILANVTKWGDG